jgi:phage gp36-like protein
MPYATQADLLSRVTIQELTQLTDDAHTGQVGQVVLNLALTEASGKIEGYCRARYQTPLQQSAEVTALCRDITVYLLYSRRPQKMTDSVETRYKDAIKLLESISSGKVQLDQPVGAAPQTPTGSAVQPTRARQTFSERNLEGFV